MKVYGVYKDVRTGERLKRISEWEQFNSFRMALFVNRYGSKTYIPHMGVRLYTE